MLAALGYKSLDELANATVPAAIRLKQPLQLGEPLGEHELIEELKNLAADNQVLRSFIGQGYYDTITPPVVLRNVLENPGWYTAYTPYQAEISQGRLEALVNYQTMVEDLTGLAMANASLLDEGTAAAEAMVMCFEAIGRTRKTFWADAATHPQTLAVMQTRATPLGIQLKIAEPAAWQLDQGEVCGALLSYPTTDGSVIDHKALITRVHGAAGAVVMATDLLALTLLTPPGELGADIAIGSAQRFGVPMGFGGPHAAFLSCKDEFRRQIPGRIIGVSRDAKGKTAFRLALQTREQHIRREKATSNICTAQVLLAVMASMYAVYHGPEGLTRIAQRVRGFTAVIAAGLAKLGHAPRAGAFFDTLRIDLDAHRQAEVLLRATERGINLRRYVDGVGLSCDETTSSADVHAVLEAFVTTPELPFEVADLVKETQLPALPAGLARSSAFLTHPTFSRYHAEHELLRYLNRLQAKDLSLTTSMIPLGSCTMKLNATTEMIPVTWPEFGRIHPFAPAEQWGGYKAMFEQLEAWLAEITGFAAISLQPNSGAQGEYAGMLAIHGYFQANRQAHRDVCLIPQSAHGTNPASAVMAGMHVVVVASAADGTIDLADLRAKAELHAGSLGALMVTYPSTHGVYEAEVAQICGLVHEAGGQVYVDGANLNALVGLARPGKFGADVSHLNLHKTFCIPHGGGGPGVGPVGVRAHLAPYLPNHPLVPEAGPATGVGPVAAAPWGSASILPISWAYIRLMGAGGLTRAPQVAVLAANYLAHALDPYYPVLYTGNDGLVAHECILDLRAITKNTGVSVEDVAKRLIDYGFHAPTMSFPVVGTLMVEPTESEDLGELDRFVAAMIAIRAEITRVASGEWPADDNPLSNAPHTAEMLVADWSHPYTREEAVYPVSSLREGKYWSPVRRIDGAYGDRHLVCSCPDPAAFEG